MVDRQDFVEPKVVLQHPQDMSHIQLSYITHFYLNQKNTDTIISLLHHYEAYAPDLLDLVYFVIVDDASPIQFSIPDFKLNFIWLRINKDILWNQGGARNLGVTYAKSDKIFMTDLDRILPEHTMRYLVNAKNPGGAFYKLRQLDEKTGKIRKGHANTFYMSRGRFMRFYGYDEEYSGGYGAEDYRFVKFQKAHGSWQRYLPKKYYCLGREEINRTESYHSLERDLTRNTPIDRRKRAENLVWGEEAGHSRFFLNFTWTQVKSYYRERHSIRRKKDRLWKKLWLFRTLFKC